MNPMELLPLALSRLAASKMRAALTMLGVIIGVGAIVALVSVAQGATSGITNLIEGLGTNLISVSPGANNTGFVRGAAGSADTLTLADAEAIASVDNVDQVAPQVSTVAVVVAGDSNTTTTVSGITPEYQKVRAYDIQRGAFITGPASEAGLRVAVIGSATAEALKLDESAVGADILVGGVPFRVIGVLQPKGILDDQVFIPLSTLRDHFVAGDAVQSISVSAADPEAIPLTKVAISNLLRARHGIPDGAEDDFTVIDQAQLLSAFGTITGFLSLLLAGIASISLLVGGIGIMNIMLVSVRERTREIGIRKAIGARNRDILLQFLVEALVLSLAGGLIGIAFGVAASAAIGVLAGWGLNISLQTIALAVGFSLAVGVVFGVWPARQAARLDPIEALRYQ
jgi:putative ABC transport system permease protein